MQTVVSRTLCDDCMSLPVATASPPPQKHLKAASDYVDTGQGYQEAQYRCTYCNTIWLHRLNKWGGCEGYRLNP